MYSLTQLLVFAAAATRALAQYNDGYETVDSSTDPVQIRLAYQGPTAMMVSWNTFSQLTSPTVSYGISPDALTESASSTVSVTYATSLTYNNHVNITGLLPYTTYYYLPQFSNATTPYTFTTARLAGDLTPYTMGVVIDMGTFGALGLSNVVGTGAAHPLAVNEQTTIASLTEMIDNYEFMVHAGDIAYADYWLKEEIQNYLPTTTTQQGAQVYESILNAFFDELIAITSQKAYMVNPGNHEANCDNGGTTNKTSGVAYTESVCLAGQTNFTGYINHWRMPSGPSGGLSNFWYSYDYGMTHFVHIDTETDLGNGLLGPDESSPEFGGPFGAFNQQIDWLTNDLASVNRTLTPWIVVFGHRGWYLSATGSVCANCKTAFETLLHTYDVDLYMNGHAHFYERSAPIYNGVIDPNGLNNPSSTLYITNGAAGHYDGLDTFTSVQPYSVFRENSDYAWSAITFTNATHMTINSFWSANNTVFDSATLYKAHVYTSGSSTSTSSTSSTSTSSTIPSSTTNTATTTSSGVFPSYTNFNGQGSLYIFTGGLLEGDIGSAGTWYNTPGQNTATYTAVPLYANGTAFTLQHSTNYCTINSDSSFGCNSDSTDATVFSQNSYGELLYNGSPAFYASSAASSGAKPTVYVTSLPVPLTVVWGVTAPTTAPPAPTTSSSATSSVSTTSNPTTTSSSTTAPSSSTTPEPTTSSFVTVTISSTVDVTETDSFTISLTSTEFDSITATQTTTLVATETDTSTIIGSVTVTQSTTITLVIPVTVTSSSTTTSLVVQTSNAFTTVTSTSTSTSTKTNAASTTVTSTFTSTKSATVVATATLTSTSTKTNTAIATVTSTSTSTKSATIFATVTSTSTSTKSTTIVALLVATSTFTETQDIIVTITSTSTLTQSKYVIATITSTSTSTILKTATTTSTSTSTIT